MKTLNSIRGIKIACVALLVTSLYPSTARRISRENRYVGTKSTKGQFDGILLVPTHTRTVRIQNARGFFLRLPTKGHVRGTRNVSDEFTTLEMESVGTSKVRIRGRTSGSYLAMDRNGISYRSANATEECVFILRLGLNQFHTFASHKYSGSNPGNFTHEWYLSIKKNGKLKHGANTAKDQKSAQFVIVYLDKL